MVWMYIGFIIITYTRIITSLTIYFELTDSRVCKIQLQTSSFRALGSTKFKITCKIKVDYLAMYFELIAKFNECNNSLQNTAIRALF